MPGPGALTRRQFRVALPREPVELCHHQAVAVRVGPAALELDRVVALVVDVGALGQDLGDAGGEAVGHEVAVSEGVLDRVGHVGRARLALVEVVGVAFDVAGRGRRQADVDRVEVGERRLPRAVDRAMALVRDHDVEVTGGVLVHAADHGLEERDGDLLLLPGRAGTEPVAGIRREDVLDRLQSLQGELVAVHQEQHLLDPAGLQEAFQVQADQVGLAGAGGKLNQEAALAELECVIEGAHRLGLIGPHGAGFALADVVLGDLDGGERPARRAHLHEPFQVAAREEAGDLTCVLVPVVPEVGQLAVGEEDERGAERLRVGQRLLLGDVGIDGVLLGLDHGQRAATLVVEDVVGAAVRAVTGRRVDFGSDHRLVGRVPVGLSQQLVYLDAGVRLALTLGHTTTSPRVFVRTSIPLPSTFATTPSWDLPFRPCRAAPDRRRHAPASSPSG